MEGAGFPDDDLLTLYGEDPLQTVQLASMQIPNSGSRLQSITLPNPTAYVSTAFHLIETNSQYKRYRSYLTMTTSLTAPPTFSPTLPTLAPTGPPTLSAIPLNDACGCTVYANFTSPTYPVGTYQSTSTQPLAVWLGEAVSFYGTNNSGGDAIIFDFYIDCSVPCCITRVNVEGRGWFVPDTLTVSNGDKSVEFGSMSLTSTAGDNAFQSYTLDMSCNSQYVTSFRLIEVNASPIGRMRSLLNVTTAAITSTTATTTATAFTTTAAATTASTAAITTAAATSSIPVTSSIDINATVSITTDPSRSSTSEPTRVSMVATPESMTPTSADTAPTYEPSGDLLATQRVLQDNDDQGEDALQSSNDHLLSFVGGIATGVALLGCCILSILCMVKRTRDRANSKHNLEEMDHSVHVILTPKSGAGDVEQPGQLQRILTPSGALSGSLDMDGATFSIPTNTALEGMHSEGYNAEYGGTLPLQMHHSEEIEMGTVGGIMEMSLADGEFVVDEESMIMKDGDAHFVTKGQ
eukprot:CAMPEP_0197045342 /NCGR_PEP_ID=MMETSP1384-20130603/21214_1 /TAXON_ID=29189 /ORGANISM="Ammonia sp." /LENGTH=521 /DNA_ID=CAMNT_0042476943 /DNA_START=36 /DNA_END=1601 /DNA_ORIENTATION=+